MVDSTYGGGPSNSNISKYQVSGLTQYAPTGNTQSGGGQSGLYVSQPCLYNTIISGTGSNPQQFLSGTYVANIPTSESSWNV